MPQKATRKAEIELPSPLHLYHHHTKKCLRVSKNSQCSWNFLKHKRSTKKHSESWEYESLEKLKLPYEFGETKIRYQGQLKRKDPSKHLRKPISSPEGLYLRSKGRPEIKKDFVKTKTHLQNISVPKWNKVICLYSDHSTERKR